MTTESTTGGDIPLYPQTKLRINATYAAGDGEALPAGQPETVEIELNEPLPEDPAGFIADLLAALFRAAPAGVTADVTVDGAEAQR